MSIVTANALPLLRESRADFQGEMSTIYPDHEDPNLFYFLPNSSQLAKNRDGKPIFQLATFGLSTPNNPDAFGTMNFILKAGLDDALKNELAAFKKKHPNARLTVVPFAESYITTLGVKDQLPISYWDKVFLAIDYPPHAGVAETEVGVNTMLTGAGAKLYREIVRQGGEGAHIMNLCFKVMGATPTMHARIHMNYQQVYEYWRASARTGWSIFGASISKVVEKLRREGHIQIEILGGDAKMEDLIFEVSKEMAKTYLVPILTAAPGPSAPEPAFKHVRFGFNQTYKEERTSGGYVLKKREFVTDSRCVPLALKELKKYANEVIVDVD
jgi:hypothetical protein